MTHTKGKAKNQGSVLPAFGNHMLKKMSERDGKDFNETLKSINAKAEGRES